MNTSTSAFKKKIVTHDGGYHADDLMGVTILRIRWPDAELARSRNPQVWATADFLVDVGGEFDPARGKFDHHQASFLAQPGSRRPSGVTYASSGLVWAHHGAQAVRRLHPALDPAVVPAVVARVDQELMQYLDQVDNGDAEVAPGLYGLAALLSQLVPTWTETPNSKKEAAELLLAAFEDAAHLCRVFLTRVVAHAVAKEQAASMIRASKTDCDGALLILPRANLPWEDVVCQEMPEVLFVVYPDSSGASHNVRTVPTRPHAFTARKDLPAHWAGLSGQELAVAAEEPSATFCHTKRFICGATTLDGALNMAKRALLAK